MGETEDHHQEILAYEAPKDNPSGCSRPHPFAVVILCLPGLLCWGLFLGLLDRFFLNLLPVPRQFLRHVDLEYVLTLWVFAVLTALISMAIYLRARPEPRPWYVWLNLLINGLGLLFTLLVVAVACWFWCTWDGRGI